MKKTKKSKWFLVLTANKLTGNLHKDIKNIEKYSSVFVEDLNKITEREIENYGADCFRNILENYRMTPKQREEEKKDYDRCMKEIKADRLKNKIK